MKTMSELEAIDDPLGIAGTAPDGRLLFEGVVEHGGGVTVYGATHLELARPVRVECVDLRPPVEDAGEREAVLERMRGELQLVHALCDASPAVARVLGVSALLTASDRWVPYVVRERLAGVPLDAWAASSRARRGRLPTPLEVLDLLEPVAAALAVAHGRGGAHGDLHPARVRVVEDGALRAVKLEGFGPGSRAASFRPTHGAPEQFDPGFGPSGPRTDVFAMALLVVELLTGAPALRGDSPGALCLSSTSTGSRPTPRGRGLHVGAELEEALQRALAVRPEQRQADVGSLWAALRAAVLRMAASTDLGGSPVPVARGLVVPSVRAVAPPAFAGRSCARRVGPLIAVVGLTSGAALAALLGRAPDQDPRPMVERAASPTASQASPQQLLRARTSDALEELSWRFPGDPAPLRELAVLEDARGRHVDAVRAVREAVRRSPSASGDGALHAIALRAARGPIDARVSAMNLLEMDMGSAGPDLLLELATLRTGGDLAADVERSLRKPAVLALATPAARIAIELRAATNPCDCKRLLERATQDADERALPLLAPLVRTDGCGFLGTSDCAKCLGDRAPVRAAIEAIQRRRRAAP